MRGVLPILVLLVACGGHGDELPDASTVDALPRQTITDMEVMPPGMVVEGSWLAGTSDQIGLQIDTTEAGIDWDIHAHANGGTQDVIAAFAQMSITYDFRPNQQTQWYMLLRNSSPDTLTVNIQMGLFGQAQWEGWQ